MSIRTERIEKVLGIRTYILDNIKLKWKSWETTQKAISDRIGIDRVRVNRVMVSKTELISLEALINIAELSGLDVSLKVSDPSDHPTEPGHECQKCRHIMLEAEKDYVINGMRQEIIELKTIVNQIHGVLTTKDSKKHLSSR